MTSTDTNYIDLTPEAMRAMTPSQLVQLLRTDVSAWNRVYNAARYMPSKPAGGRYWRPDLSGADLSGADLRDAFLRGAFLSDAFLRGPRQDLHEILDALPAEAPALREAMKSGRINGSVYEGEANGVFCGCLKGTLEHIHGDVSDSPLSHDMSPAEDWFMPIRPGDTPESDTEGGFRLRTALAWMDEWDARNTRLIAALAPVGGGVR